jgi:hypothetical protein
VKSPLQALVQDDNFVLHMETMDLLSAMTEQIPTSSSQHQDLLIAYGIHSDQCVSIMQQVMSSSMRISTHSIVAMSVSGLRHQVLSSMWHDRSALVEMVSQDHMIQLRVPLPRVSGQYHQPMISTELLLQHLAISMVCHILIQEVVDSQDSDIRSDTIVTEYAMLRYHSTMEMHSSMGM